MEQKQVITNNINEQLVLDKYLIFLWKCEKKEYVGGQVVYTFSRDDSIPQIEEVRKLEKEYGEYKIGSMLPTFIFPALAMVLLTVLLILYIIQKENFNIILWFCSLGIPAILCIVASAIFMILRSMTVKKISTEKPIKDAEYKKKISELVK